MAKREQIGIDAGAVNAAFGTWIKFRGTPDVPPIAHQSGVSYQPAQHTLYKEFSDAFKSLPELLKGARNTYETYWEQAKKSADDYRKGKSLAEINAELDAGEVPLQYRPLLMSALEFRQGQESMQMAAQELTTKINSGEYADLSPIDLDQAVTDFMNEQLGGLQEAHGTTGGTDAFYNGYYSEVAKVREFAQQRNDQLVEQRRQQDIQIQAQSMANELGQTALSAQDVIDGLSGARDTLNLDPASELDFLQSVFEAAKSNPNGLSLINDLRSMKYRDGTLEDFFTKAYFDSATIDVANTLRQADAEKWINDNQEWDRLAAQGNVGALKNLLAKALEESDNLLTQEVKALSGAVSSATAEQIREGKARAKEAEALLKQKEQYVSKMLDKATENAFSLLNSKVEQAKQNDAMQNWIGGTGSGRAFHESLGGSIEETTDVIYNVFSLGYNNVINESDPTVRQQKIDTLSSVVHNALKGDYKGTAATALRETFPYLNMATKLTEADKADLIKNPSLMYNVLGGVDPDLQPEEYARIKQLIDNEIQLYQSLGKDTLVTQSIFDDAQQYGGNASLSFAFNQPSPERVIQSVLRAEQNFTDKKLSASITKTAALWANGNSHMQTMYETWLNAHVTSPDDLRNRQFRVQANKEIKGMHEQISPEARNFIGTPMYDAPVVSKAYMDRVTNGLSEVNSLLGEGSQWDMNLVDNDDVGDIVSIWSQGAMESRLRMAYYATHGTILPSQTVLTHAEMNGIANENGWQFRMNFSDNIGESGDLVVDVVDLFGISVLQGGGEAVGVDLKLQLLKENPSGLNGLLEMGTGKTFNQLQKMRETSDIINQNTPSYLKKIQQERSETMSGRQAAIYKAGSGGLKIR